MSRDSDPALIGDVADLLGKIGSRQAIPYLEKLTENIDPDIVEAATFALEEIKTRGV
jgi:HEAT repeat protein